LSGQTNGYRTPFPGLGVEVSKETDSDSVGPIRRLGVEEGVGDRPFISAVERDEARCRLGLVSCGGRGSFLFRSFRGVESGESLPAGIIEDVEDPKVMIDPSVDEVGG
jgi:hypothetical protein